MSTNLTRTLGGKNKANVHGEVKIKSSNRKVKWKSLHIKDEEAKRITKELWRAQTCHETDTLKISGIIEIQNENARLRMCNALKNLKNTYDKKKMKILFHGTSYQNVEKILMTPSQFISDFKKKGGMLGGDPQKSYYYCQGRQRHILRCIVYLGPNSKYAKPGGQYKNSTYDEYCVYNPDHILITHVIRVSKGKPLTQARKKYCRAGLRALFNPDRSIVWYGFSKKRNRKNSSLSSSSSPKNSKKKNNNNNIFTNIFTTTAPNQNKKESILDKNRCEYSDRCNKCGDENHVRKYYHPCRYGSRCDPSKIKNIDLHRNRFYHPCRHGKKCTNRDQLHRNMFSHPTTLAGGSGGEDSKRIITEWEVISPKYHNYIPHHNKNIKNKKKKKKQKIISLFGDDDDEESESDSYSSSNSSDDDDDDYVIVNTSTNSVSQSEYERQKREGIIKRGSRGRRSKRRRKKKKTGRRQRRVRQQQQQFQYIPQTTGRSGDRVDYLFRQISKMSRSAGTVHNNNNNNNTSMMFNPTNNPYPQQKIVPNNNNMLGLQYMNNFFPQPQQQRRQQRHQRQQRHRRHQQEESDDDEEEEVDEHDDRPPTTPPRQKSSSTTKKILSFLENAFSGWKIKKKEKKKKKKKNDDDDEDNIDDEYVHVKSFDDDDEEEEELDEFVHVEKYDTDDDDNDGFLVL